MVSMCGFNPRTPCGVRPSVSCVTPLTGQFQSTHSLRSATQVLPQHEVRQVVSIHALLAECDLGIAYTVPVVNVSIHALLAECDLGFICSFPFLPGFNPRTPCGVRPPMLNWPCSWKGFNPRTPCGVRLKHTCDSTGDKRFQSTHSLRSATRLLGICFNVRPVSIHAPVRVRPNTSIPIITTLWFQSTHP